ncbi:Tyrosine--tRNA ligase [compost metagenome]
MIKLLTLLGFAASNGEARRSIQQGSVKFNEDKITDFSLELEINDGDVIQMGKRKFAKLARK